MWVPGDGVVDPYAVCYTLAVEAVKEGVQIFENCKVERVLTSPVTGSVMAVETEKGIITCDVFVNCAGSWARHVGQLGEPAVKVPLHACEHHILLTEDVPGLIPNMPVIQDLDGGIFLREKDSKMIGGGYEPVAKPVEWDHDEYDRLRQRAELPPDWDHFYVLLEQILHRMPKPLTGAVVKDLTNFPECFTVDGKWILGEAPEVRNYFVASGLKTLSAAAAGGVGNLIAQLVVKKEPSFDIFELDIRRFIGLHNNRRLLRDRVTEVPGLHSKISYPFDEFTSGRNLRLSPIYPRLRAAGAVFSQLMGYERPAWFERNAANSERETQSSRVALTGTFGKPPWFETVRSEYVACREGVAILDYSSFTKIELRSRSEEVVQFLQTLCSNDVDIQVGCIAHSGMQNTRGGYENDCSLARLAENHYMMIAPTIQQARCKSWLEKHLPRDGSVAITDVTSMYTAICLMGKHARALLSEVSDADMSSANFPFFTFKEMSVGLATGIRVMNLTHTGEIGWILYIPSEYALHVYDRLVEAGNKFNVTHAGSFAMRTLRIEKFYAFWGQDLDTTTTPRECGRAFRVKFNKGNFIGRDALLRQEDDGVKRKYVQLVLENHDADNDPWPWGQEPVYRDGKFVGITTTTCYGYTLERQVCLGFVQHLDEKNEPQVVTTDYVLKGLYEVEIAGRRFPAKINLHSPHLRTASVESQQESYMATRMDGKQMSNV